MKWPGLRDGFYCRTHATAADDVAMNADLENEE
jgi:hypothetical protein